VFNPDYGKKQLCELHIHDGGSISLGVASQTTFFDNEDHHQRGL